MKRKKATELYKELQEQLNNVDKIKEEISERYEFLLERYGDKLIPSPNCNIFNTNVDEQDLYFNRLQYIDKVEKYIGSQNIYKQLSLFDQ